MYYVLECFGPEDEDRAGIGEVPDIDGVDWNLGRRFDKPPPTPIPIELNPEFPGVMVPMFDSGILLFRDDMLAALREAGVDNLDVYQTIIRDPVTGQAYENYVAVNVIGLVACADLARSAYSTPTGSALIDTDFDSLAIDESRTRGLPMFRLAECVSAIVIHEKVKHHLQQKQIPYLSFVPPEEWSG